MAGAALLVGRISDIGGGAYEECEERFSRYFPNSRMVGLHTLWHESDNDGFFEVHSNWLSNTADTVLARASDLIFHIDRVVVLPGSFDDEIASILLRMAGFLKLKVLDSGTFENISEL